MRLWECECLGLGRVGTPCARTHPTAHALISRNRGGTELSCTRTSGAPRALAPSCLARFHRRGVGK
eukprot:6177203-Pleurochrysis_carterae.AAC.2